MTSYTSAHLSICQIVFIDEMFEQRLQIMMIERVSVEHSLVVCKIYHYAVNCRQRVHTAYPSEGVDKGPLGLSVSILFNLYEIFCTRWTLKDHYFISLELFYRHLLGIKVHTYTT